MTSRLMTPGVYIEEKNAFPNSVAEVATAVPIFIGYTQKAERKASSLIHKPIRISSFAEYVELFGKSFKSKFELVQEASGKSDKAEAERTQETILEDRKKKSKDNYLIIDEKKWYVLLKDKHTAYMYNSIRLFFGNGGGACYILSVGTYGNNTEVDIKPEEIINEDILGLLEKEQEPTLVVAPDLIEKGEEAYSSYKRILVHCSKVKRRFAILDIAKPETSDTVGNEAVISVFREKIGFEALSYGAAYCPWLKTSIVQPDEVDEENLDLSVNQLKEILPEKSAKELLDKYEKELSADPTQRKENYHKALKLLSPTYVAILDTVRDNLNLLPPSAAMAGIYTMVDNTRGVWKAPANVSVNMTYKPSVNIPNELQEGFNVDILGGKSINVIRAFPGIGTLVWGGRTLDGNSQDWRYINVRRSVIMIEQSIKLAASAYIFEPNNASTWATIKSMISNFLNNLWKQGALAGATPGQAFDVQVGLGSTMTATDILEGKMLINIKVAIVRPAEFIVITLEQQMQKT